MDEIVYLHGSRAGRCQPATLLNLLQRDGEQSCVTADGPKAGTPEW
jgi:hypothetical protein